jgi:hypothetical protein
MEIHQTLLLFTRASNRSLEVSKNSLFAARRLQCCGVAVLQSSGQLMYVLTKLRDKLALKIHFSGFPGIPNFEL